MHEKLSKTDDAVLITVHTKSSMEKCPDFVKEQGIAYPVAIDGEGKTCQTYGVRAYPTYMVVGKDGKLVSTDLWPPDQVEAVVEKARKAEAPPKKDSEKTPEPPSKKP